MGYGACLFKIDRCRAVLKYCAKCTVDQHMEQSESQVCLKPLPAQVLDMRCFPSCSSSSWSTGCPFALGACCVEVLCQASLKLRIAECSVQLVQAVA